MNNPIDIPQALELIYEAGAVPEKWPHALDTLAQTIQCVGGILFTTNLDRMRWTSSPDIRPLFDIFLTEGWASINPRPARFGHIALTEFVADHHHFSEEEMAHDRVYTDFFRKNGLGYSVGTMLNIPSGDQVIFTFEKAHLQGPVEESATLFLDRLRPHLARAALLSARFGLEKSHAITDALGALGLPAATLRANGRVLTANHAFARLLDGPLEDRDSRLVIKRSSADGLLAQAIALQNTSAAADISACSIPIAAERDAPPFILHLMPIAGAAHDVFASAAMLVIVTPVNRKIIPAASVIAGLFDLTSAEARVAREIAAGARIETIAGAFGTSSETVRKQIKSVFAKTGIRNQVDLAALLNGIALP